MALLVYSYDFLTLTAATLANIGQNDADVATLLNGNIRAVNLHDNAGIRSNQIVDRFNTYHVEKTLVPISAELAIDGTPVLYPVSTIYTSDLWRLRSKIRTKNGQLKMLCAIDMWVESAAGQAFSVEVLKNGVQVVAGSILPIAVADPDNTFYELANDNPLDNPYAAFSNLDILEYRCGYSTTTGGTIRAVHVTEHWKSELTS